MLLWLFLEFCWSEVGRVHRRGTVAVLYQGLHGVSPVLNFSLVAEWPQSWLLMGCLDCRADNGDLGFWTKAVRIFAVTDLSRQRLVSKFIYPYHFLEHATSKLSSCCGDFES